MGGSFPRRSKVGGVQRWGQRWVERCVQRCVVWALVVGPLRWPVVRWLESRRMGGSVVWCRMGGPRDGLYGVVRLESRVAPDSPLCP